MIQKIISKIKIDKSFIKNSTIIFSGSLLVSILNYLFKTLNGRFLGPVDYGTVSFLISIVSLFTIFSISIDNVVTKFTTEELAKNNKRAVTYIYNILSKYAFYIGLAIFIILLILSNYIGINFKVDPIYIKFIGLIFLFIFLNNVAKGVVRGNKAFKQLSFINISEALVKLGLFYLLFKYGFEIKSSIFALIGSSIFTIVYTRIILKKYLTKKTEKIEAKKVFKYFSNTFLALGFFSLLTFIDIPLAKYFLDEKSAGLYAALSDMGKIIFYAITPIMLVMFPVISEMHTKGKKHYQILAQTIGLIFLLGIPALIIYYFFPERLIGILYGSEFLSVSNSLAYIGFAMFLLVICNMFAQYFLSIKKVRFFWLIFITLALEIILFYNFHNSISQIVYNLIYSFSFLLLLFIVYYLYNKKDHIKNLLIEFVSAD